MRRRSAGWPITKRSGAGAERLAVRAMTGPITKRSGARAARRGRAEVSSMANAWHAPPDCKLLLWMGQMEPEYRHSCGGTVKTRRSRPDSSIDRAQCDTCRERWARPDARYRWRSQNAG